MFRRISTELALIYAALFGGVLLAIAGAVYLAVENNSRNAVRAEMSASSAVFDRLWTLRADHLSDTAELLSRDFGFRQAFATGDTPTIVSALENLQLRSALDGAFVVDLDGELTGFDGELSDAESEALVNALYDTQNPRGILTLGGAPFQAVAQPINAPTLIGWVVFAQQLGDGMLDELEQLSAIPLTAHLFVRNTIGGWDMAGGDSVGEGLKGEALAERAFGSASRGFFRIPENDAIAGLKDLAAFAEGAEASLLLEYSLKTNQAHYRDLMGAILLIGLAGMVVLIGGSWIVSGRVTGPISALRAAANRLAKGELTQVHVKGRNEIAELAANFNQMSGEIAAREQRILHLARHDIETGLPNPGALDDELARLRISHPAQQIFALAIGVERFARIRGAIGHDLSARLIEEVAARASAAGGGMLVGRIATDMAAAVFSASDAAAAQRIADAVAHAVTPPVALNGARVDIQATLGLAIDAADGETGLSLLERAEVAVAQTRARRESTGVFSRAAYGDPSSTLSLMSSMIAGLESGEMFLAHQPKLNLKSGDVTSAESLIRWRRNGALIRPDHFIGMAEETGHIRPLTDWVIQRAIADQRLLRESGSDVALSVNISGRLIADEDFAERALKMVTRADARLCFEITETAVIDSNETALQVMNALNSAGIDISIDDYGSGLSSLSYLKLIPARELKIDKLFIDGVGSSTSDALLVQSTIDLAHALGMSVTAEGVEDADTLDRLAGMRADKIQGYHVAKPMALDDFQAFMAQRARGAARTA